MQENKKRKTPSIDNGKEWHTGICTYVDQSVSTFHFSSNKYDWDANTTTLVNYISKNKWDYNLEGYCGMDKKGTKVIIKVYLSIKNDNEGNASFIFNKNATFLYSFLIPKSDEKKLVANNYFIVDDYFETYGALVDFFQSEQIDWKLEKIKE